MDLIYISGSEWTDVKERQDFHSSSQLWLWLPIKTTQTSAMPTIGHGMWTGWPFAAKGPLREKVASGYATHASVCKPFVSLIQRYNRVFHTSLLFIFATDPYWNAAAVNFLVCYNILQLLFKCCSLQRSWSSYNNTFTHVALVDAVHEDAANQLLIWLKTRQLKRSNLRGGLKVREKRVSVGDAALSLQHNRTCCLSRMTSCSCHVKSIGQLLRHMCEVVR